MIQTFRLLSLIEGVSLITLLFVAMPARHFLDIDFVWIVGLIHGLLWVAYFGLSLVVSHRLGWSVLAWLFAVVCSVLPLGFVALDQRLKRQSTAQASSHP